MSIFEYDHEAEMKKLEDELRETIRAEEHEKSWTAGLAEGRAEGIAEGRAKGMAEGRTRFLLLVLNLRGTVPEWLKERILCERDSELLESWMKAAANAVSVEDFLGKTGLKESV